MTTSRSASVADPETAEPLEIELPSSPQSLLRLSLLIGDERARQDDIAALVESDMPLAATVLKATNSARFALPHRVRSVREAVTYLGARELTALTFEMALRAAFGDQPELEPIWRRAGERGQRMGQLAATLGVDAWAAHSAGLFEECGKAALFRHRPQHYPAMLRAAPDDADLIALERAGFGISHDELGARLCTGWGLDRAAVASVRLHLVAYGTLSLPPMPAGDATLRQPLALSIVVRAVADGDAAIDAAVDAVAGPAELDDSALRRAAHRLRQHQHQQHRRGTAPGALGRR